MKHSVLVMSARKHAYPILKAIKNKEKKPQMFILDRYGTEVHTEVCIV
uniref:Uncharacterized protein n=1 Tax=Anguilla anguilla TaxID=7936 RepID=A0A0E9RFL8_ANGAN